jgi:hypothetical protein
MPAEGSSATRERAPTRYLMHSTRNENRRHRAGDPPAFLTGERAIRQLHAAGRIRAALEAARARRSAVSLSSANKVSFGMLAMGCGHRNRRNRVPPRSCRCRPQVHKKHGHVSVRCPRRSRATETTSSQYPTRPPRTHRTFLPARRSTWAGDLVGDSTLGPTLTGDRPRSFVARCQSARSSGEPTNLRRSSACTAGLGASSRAASKC